MSSSKPLLLLHDCYTPEDADIWRVAIRRGWSTERVSRHNVAEKLAAHTGAPMIRYYGNLLNWSQIDARVPVTMMDVDPTVLPTLGAFTKRSITLVPFKKLDQPVRSRSFIKPLCVKWFQAKVYNEGELVTGAPELNDLIYVQTPVQYINEVRCFCLDGKVLTSSLYRINGVVWDRSGLPEDQINYDSRLSDSPIPEMVAAIYATNLLPRAVVADFGTHPDGSWSLVEFNEPWCSGLYLCDPEKCFDCIVETQSQKA